MNIPRSIREDVLCNLSNEELLESLQYAKSELRKHWEPFSFGIVFIMLVIFLVVSLPLSLDYFFGIDVWGVLQFISVLFSIGALIQFLFLIIAPLIGMYRNKGLKDIENAVLEELNRRGLIH
jgi:hypothetical protein